MTETIALHTRLKPGAAEEYEMAHANIPAELVAVLRDAGVLNWRIWRSGEDLFHLVDVRDYQAMRHALAEHPTTLSGRSGCPPCWLWRMTTRVTTGASPRCGNCGNGHERGLFRSARFRGRGHWKPLPCGGRRRRPGNRRGCLGRRHPLLRHCTALRPRTLGAQAWPRLRDKPRDEFLVSTKVGRLLVPAVNTESARDDEGFDVPADLRRVWDPTEAGIRRSLEDSLGRLGLDRVDVLYLHDPDAYDLEAGITQALPAMEKLRAEGLVKAIGVGSNSSDALLECVQRSELDLVMLAGRYTLLEQPAQEHLLPASSSAGWAS